MAFDEIGQADTAVVSIDGAEVTPPAVAAARTRSVAAAERLCDTRPSVLQATALPRSKVTHSALHPVARHFFSGRRSCRKATGSEPATVDATRDASSATLDDRNRAFAMA